MLTLSIFYPAPGFTQTTESGESQSQEAINEAPKVIEEPAYPYYYWPEEDLNSFGLSTMGQGKSGSTLGEKTKRESNIEANAYLKSKKEDKENAENSQEPGAAVKSDEPLYEEPAQEPPPHSVSEKPIYEWKDESGTVHITNDLGKVPPEYQDQFFQPQEPPQ